MKLSDLFVELLKRGKKNQAYFKMCRKRNAIKFYLIENISEVFMFKHRNRELEKGIDIIEVKICIYTYTWKEIFLPFGIFRRSTEISDFVFK